MPLPAGQSALLEGCVRRATLRLALPSLVSMLFSSLAALLDAFFLARLNAQATAAVGICFPLITVIQTIGFTGGMGAGSLLSRLIGQKNANLSQANAACATALYGALALCLLFCTLGLLFPGALLSLLGADTSNLAAAAAYSRFVLLSGPPTCASLILCSLLRGQGHTRPSMIAYGLGTLLGAALCFLFVFRLSWGIQGVGAAMLFREALILLLFIFYTLRLPGVHRPRITDIRIRCCVVADIMQSGTPTLVRQGLASIASIMMSRACARLDTTILAGMGVALRVMTLISSCVIGFLQGFSPVFGAAYGTGDTTRMQEGYVFCRRLLRCALFALGAALYLFAPWLTARFSLDAQTARFAALVLRAQSIVLPAQGAVLLMNAAAQSVGFPLRATLIAASRQGYVLIPLLLILPRFFGAAGIICAQPASDLISLFIGWALMKNFTGFSSSPCGCCDARKGSR